MSTALILAEDDDSAAFLRQVLRRKFGCVTIHTYTPEDSIRAMQTVKTDLVLVDTTSTIAPGLELIPLLEEIDYFVSVFFYSAEDIGCRQIFVDGRLIPITLKPDYRSLLRLISRTMSWQIQFERTL